MNSESKCRTSGAHESNGRTTENRFGGEKWLLLIEIADGYHGWCLGSTEAVRMFSGYVNEGVKTRLVSLRDTVAREWFQLTFGWG